MPIKVMLKPLNKVTFLNYNRIKVRDLVRELGFLSPEEVVVVKNGNVVPEDEVVEESDNVVVYVVVSTG